ncbi:MAG: hypothetical protein E6K35_04295 [Gammaproteobacteria bacterium]|nr:MAG: hypothetical protein E6K35_04295 [Gammaproteobacteria bacterium]
MTERGALRGSGERSMADRHEWFLKQIFRHRADLQRYLRQFTSGAEDIEDLIQETYVRVYSLPNYRAVDSPVAAGPGRSVLQGRVS